MLLFLAAHAAGVGSIGLVAAVYPGVWSMAQIATGHWSDSIGRKPLIVAGMLLQAIALSVLALSDGAVAIATVTAGPLGLGTALVYPTLIAAMSDAVAPSRARRSSASIASGATAATRSAQSSPAPPPTRSATPARSPSSPASQRLPASGSFTTCPPTAARQPRQLRL